MTQDVKSLQDRLKVLEGFKAAWFGQRTAHRITALPAGRTWRDMVLQLAILSSTVPADGSADVVVGLPENADFDFLARCTPFISQCFIAPARQDGGIDLDWFDIGKANPFASPHEDWQRLKRDWPDQVLTRSMLLKSPVGLSDVKTWSLPDTLQAAGRKVLAELGVDHSRPLVALAFPSPQGVDGTQAPQKLDPEIALGVVENLTTKGFEVIRLGVAGGMALPDRKGIIDISSSSQPLALQAAILSQAACFVGQAGGISALSCALGCPACVLDPVEPLDHPWGEKASLWQPAQPLDEALSAFLDKV